MFPNDYISLIKRLMFIFRNISILMWHKGVYINWLELFWQLWHEPWHHKEEICSHVRNLWETLQPKLL